MHIKIRKGLNIPIKGQPFGAVQTLPLPSVLALDLDPFDFVRFTLRKKVGDAVKVGEAVAEDKKCPGRVFVSPASGEIKEVIRGLKRRVLQVVIATDQKQTPFEQKPLSLKQATPEEVCTHLLKGGIFPHIRLRPGLRLPDPEKLPEAIFVQALDSAPFAPPPELEVDGFESAFASGLEALNLICPEHVHLVFQESTTCKPFLEANHVQKHTASGPHPIGNPSVHIEKIHPLRKSEQRVWTLDVNGVVAVGMMVAQGVYHHQQIVSISGEGIPEHQRGFFRLMRGYPIQDLVHGRCYEGEYRYISGDPLTGKKVECTGFMGFFHRVFCVVPELSKKRELFHFMRLGRRHFSTTRAYFPKWRKKEYPFTTHQHGEERAFVDATLYDKVMPMRIPVMHLIKAFLAEDYEKAEELGLLEVVPEDFALPAFVCPSKIEMMQIVEEGLKAYTKQYYE